jgi:succinylglutamate desuccinylase
MEPGFANLARANAGQLLARSRKGDVRAPKDGMIILPLYQGQGADGFFWGRVMSPARMRLSEALRRVKADRFLRFLPGVSRDRALPTKLVVDRRAAALMPVELFQLFGYRRMNQDASGVTLERQAERPHLRSDA